MVGGLLHWTLTLVPRSPDGDRDKRNLKMGVSETEIK